MHLNLFILPLANETGVKKMRDTTFKLNLKSDLVKSVFKKFDNCCAACGQSDPDILEVDHVEPQISEKCTNDFSNLQILCHACNNLKGDLKGAEILKPRKRNFEGSVKRILKNRTFFRLSLDKLRKVKK